MVELAVVCYAGKLQLSSNKKSRQSRNSLSAAAAAQNGIMTDLHPAIARASLVRRRTTSFNNTVAPDDNITEPMLKFYPQLNGSVQYGTNGTPTSVKATLISRAKIDGMPELIDRISLILFPLMFTGFNLLYWWYYVLLPLNSKGLKTL